MTFPQFDRFTALHKAVKQEDDSGVADSRGGHRMRRTLTSLALIAAFALPAFADDSRLVTSVTLQDLQTIISEEGHTINSTGDDGAVSVRATDTNNTGLIFNEIGTALGLAVWGSTCRSVTMRMETRPCSASTTPT
jgi:hypothetical protein